MAEDFSCQTQYEVASREFQEFPWISIITPDRECPFFPCGDLPVVFGLRVPWFPEYDDGVPTLVPRSEASSGYNHPTEQVPRFVRRIKDKIESRLIDFMAGSFE